MAEFLSVEWQNNRKKEAIGIIKDMKKDKIGFSTDEMWEEVVGYLLDWGCFHPMAYRIAKEAFEACGYTVE